MSKYDPSYYQRRKEQIDESNRRYKENNRAKVTTINADWYEKNKEDKNSYTSKYQKQNKAKVNALAAKRRAIERQATPKWLTLSQLREMEEMYELAQELTWLNQDGKPFDVDHIIPLQGVNVSGFHVPWNLQLLPASENRRKRNRVIK